MTNTVIQKLDSKSVLTIQAFREEDSAQLTEMSDIRASSSQGFDVSFEVGVTSADDSQPDDSGY